MADQVKIQVVINEKVAGIDYVDAIYYPDLASYQTALSNGDHQVEKDKRTTNFFNAVKNPPAPKVYTKAELQAQKAEYVAQTDAQIAQFDAEIAKK